MTDLYTCKRQSDIQLNLCASEEFECGKALKSSSFGCHGAAQRLPISLQRSFWFPFAAGPPAPWESKAVGRSVPGAAFPPFIEGHEWRLTQAQGVCLAVPAHSEKGHVQGILLALCSTATNCFQKWVKTQKQENHLPFSQTA